MKRVCIGILICLLVYCAAGGIIMGVQLHQMNNQNATATQAALGQMRRAALIDQGVAVTQNLYADAEIAAEPAKAAVKLHYFPNPQNEKTRFVIVCPGGAYATCAVDVEGYPVAAQLNALGYTAFVLEYRVGENGGEFAALDDLAAAVRFITAHADAFNVDPNEYALLGFSAGGDLVGLFGTEETGYAKYVGVAKPSVIFMGYPWVNMNIRTANPAKCMMYTVLNSMGYKGLIGRHATAQEKRSMRVPWQVTDAYPPCYLMHGTTDVIVPAKTHTDVLAQVLEQHGVVYAYERAPGVNHGCGVGAGTSAEDWLSRAIDFWETRILTAANEK